MTFGFALLLSGFLLLDAGWKGVTPIDVLKGVTAGTKGPGGVLKETGREVKEGVTRTPAQKGGGTETLGPPAPNASKLKGEKGNKARARKAQSPFLPASIAAGVTAATTIVGRPYVWGGGHASFISWGYDCSGAVSYVLHAMGVLSSPLTSGALMSYGEAGPGKWVTIYANEAHTFMHIKGFGWFGTGSDKEAFRGGPAWGNHDPDLSAYTVRHPVGL